MADHFAMDGIADYSIISGLQTTYIQRSTTALNYPICCICQCKFLNNRISRRKCIRLQGVSEEPTWGWRDRLEEGREGGVGWISEKVLSHLTWESVIG